MKIISLNLWGGRVRQKLVEFIETHQDIDIFCFQEMYCNATGKEDHVDWQDGEFELYDVVQGLLPNHHGYFYPHLLDFWGLAIFIKKEIPILDENVQRVHVSQMSPAEQRIGHVSKDIQFITTAIGSKKITVINFHGLWNGQGKTDTPERVEQSKKVLDFCKTLDHEFILCGDFNLSPDTESLQMFEKSGLRNLIKENNITSTRTSFYTKSERYADYAFTTPNLIVKEFKVLPDEVSDHSILYIEIE